MLLELFSSTLQQPLIISSLVVLFSTSAFFSTRASTLFNYIISHIFNKLLLLLYPIKHEDGSPIPSIPYTWPNGQGTDKFLDGKRKSAEWGARFGSIYRLWSGHASEVVLSTPSQVQTFFRDSDQHTKAVNNDSGWLFGEVLGVCVGLVSQGRWRRVRDVVEPYFAHPSAKQYVGMIRGVAHDYVQELAQTLALRAGEEGEFLFDAAQDTKFYSFLTVARIFYGDLDEQQTKVLKGIAPGREALWKHVIDGGLSRLSISRFLPTEANRCFIEFQSDWQKFNQEAFEKQLKLGGTAPICQIWKAMDEGRISKTEMLQTLDESMFANLDVTASGLSWSLILLAQHPAIQEQVRAEILKHHGAERTSPGTINEYLQRSDTFLAYCILEASRLRPILPFSNPESALTDRVIDGYRIPANTNVIVDAHAINIHNPFWGPSNEAAEYRPSRLSRLRQSQIRYNLWRFGFGPRKCLGQYVADRLIRSLAAELLARYRLSIVDDGRGSASPGSGGDGIGNLDGAREAKVDFATDGQCWTGLPMVKVRCTPLED